MTEQIFAWLNTIGAEAVQTVLRTVRGTESPRPQRRTRFKGKQRTSLYATLATASFNLLKIANLERNLVTSHG